MLLESGLFWLLLPLAAASGWWAAVWSQRRQQRRASRNLHSAYGKGINYLLNEQPDKATEVLVRMVEVDPDTVELHLALGSLFRRRGEVDRAIRVHRNIIQRAGLSERLRAQARLELGLDFLKAGMLDRAERALRELLDDTGFGRAARRHLIELYQQEKEWSQALELAREFAATGDVEWRTRVAQYLCALGEAALETGNSVRAVHYASQALDTDPDCLRASLLKAHALRAQGLWQEAVQVLQNVETQCPDMLPEVLDEIRELMQAHGQARAWTGYLDALARRQPWLAFYRRKVVEQGVPAAAAPMARYRCRQCGFDSRRLFWQCPGCQCWSSAEALRTGLAE